MDELYFLVEEVPEGGYTARALGESIFTQGDTLDELRLNIKDAVNCHFDDEKPHTAGAADIQSSLTDR